MSFQSHARAILFDFVGVLLFPHSDSVPDPQLDAITARMGQVTDDQLFQAAIQQHHQLSNAAFHQALRRIVAKYVPFQPLWHQLPALRQTFRLAVVNNGTYLTIPLFQEQLPRFEIFDAFVSSAREGMCKPDPAIYLCAAQRVGVGPEACLFMDDSERNIAGAQAVGMQTIHWPSAVEGWQAFQEWLHNAAT